MRWSNAVRLKDYYRSPRQPGVYEIGFTRDDIFNPVYIGMSEKTTIYERLKAHYNGTGNKDVQSYLLIRERDNLWCHWILASEPASTEANLLARFGISKNGFYRFNKRLEKQKGK